MVWWSWSWCGVVVVLVVLGDVFLVCFRQVWYVVCFLVLVVGVAVLVLVW